ncbi:peptide MFS transporter [Streptosporangium sp. NPDC000396]|uniref:peptide MFS transporter n=1 Tax=Streptosporangium sp. NPDC000396 TaxID=3366185 RepID=UPI0036CA0698
MSSPDPPVRALSPWRQPRWFSTLFLTDLWERFSFFGMMAILFLYASTPAAEGGLGMLPGSAGALVGLYISATFVASVPGGWLGDRLFGAQRAVLYGAALIASGHLCLVIPAEGTFYLGITLIAAGTGLFKPNLSALLGAFYPSKSSAQREAGFSVFFISIQIGALLAPLVTGFLGEKVDWHLGFGAAAVGMGVGILVYLRGLRHLGDVGREPRHRADPAILRRVGLRTALGLGLACVPVTAGALAGALRVEYFVAVVGALVLLSPVPYIRTILRGPEVTEADRVRLRAYAWVFLSTAVLFLLVSQGNSVLNRFAAESTDRVMAGFTVPASWFQALHPLFILLAAPVIARIWAGPGGRLSVPVKLAAGLSLAAASFVPMIFAGQAAFSGPVSPLWLILVYLIQSLAELIIGTVGLGVTAQIAPAGATSRLMGLWWLAGAVGAVVGGQLARLAMSAGSGSSPAYFLALTLLPAAVAIALAVRRDRITARLAPGGSLSPSHQFSH